MPDLSRLVCAMDAIQRVLAVGIKVERAGAHWIACTTFDIVRKRTEPRLLTLGWRPSGPLFLAADCGQAGPRLAVLAHDRAVANRLALGKNVVNVACVGIDQDRAWRFLPVVIDNLTPIGGWNTRLLIRRICQVLLFARCENWVKNRTRPHAATKDTASPNA